MPMPLRKDVNRDVRMRILVIERMLREDRYINALVVVERLDRIYDIQCNRETVYKDMYAIDRFIPLEMKSGKNGGFRRMKIEW
jgi:hypothetical protein